MKYAVFVIGVILALSSCTDVKEKAAPVSSTNRKHIENWYNSVTSLKAISIDSVKISKMEKAVENEPPEYKAMVSIVKATFYNSKSSYERALKNHEKALWQLRHSEADSLRAYAYTGIGNCYKHTGDYPKALRNLYKALAIYENQNDNEGISRVNAYIGEVHMQKMDFESAKENLKIALKRLEKDKSAEGWLSAAHTLANVYGMSGDYQSALVLDEEGIRISDSINSLASKSTFFDNKANCYLYTGKLDSAQYYFEQCLKIDIASGNKKQIADTYSNLGNLAAFQKDFNKAEGLALQSIAILKTTNNNFNLAKSHKILSDIYKRKGDHKKALEAYEEFYKGYEKTVDEKKEASLAEFKIVHQTDRKEKELAESRVELLQKNAEVRQRNYMVVVLALLVFFIILIASLINRQHKLKNRQQVQEHELKTAISKIETQNKLQNQRLDISRDLHDNIGAQLTFIISSVDNIKYAFDLRDAKLDNKLQNISLFANETIIELRDTIWAMNNSEITFEDLRSRIFNFIEKAKEVSESVEFKYTVSESLAEAKFSSIVGMNIHRTIQEAINNALKYANASKISIDIRPERHDIIIVVSDDGSGFDMATTERGNGLSNMEKRIDDIGGKFTVISEPGKGTEISMLLPEDLKAKK
jgi:signal transduction histidine kinase